MTPPRRFALVAGEESGDQLGAALIHRLATRYPGANFCGIGGERMRAAGMETWWDCGELALFGLFEVAAHLPRLLRLRRELLRRVLAAQPDAFIGIDAPDFNLGLERKLKALGVTTIHYVSPTVWAWREGRAHGIAASADLVLCLFPFEPRFYADHGVAATYVGHPLADQIEPGADSRQARRQLALDPDAPVIALLPGSRGSEVSRLAQPILDAVTRLKADIPRVQFVSALANSRVRELFATAVRAAAAPVSLVDGRAHEVIAAADVVICASGTVTLEALLINRPMVMIYRLAPSTYWLARLLRLVKARRFALPNILAGDSLVPELIQHEATGARIAAEAKSWLENDSARTRLAVRFDELHAQLRCDASRQAAEAIARLVERPA